MNLAAEESLGIHECCFGKFRSSMGAMRRSRWETTRRSHCLHAVHFEDRPPTPSSLSGPRIEANAPGASATEKATADVCAFAGTAEVAQEAGAWLLRPASKKIRRGSQMSSHPERVALTRCPREHFGRHLARLRFFGSNTLFMLRQCARF